MITLSKYIVIIGTDPKGNGGIASALTSLSNFYIPFNLIVSHRDGNVLIKIITFFSALFRFTYFCAFKNIKIVHINTASNIDFYRNSFFVLIAKIFRKRIILQVHGGYFSVFYKKNRYYVKYICHLADMLLGVSNYVKEMLEYLQLNNSVRLLYNVVPMPVLHRIEESQEKLRLLFIGSITEMKGIFDVLYSISLHKEDLQEKIELHIAGKGEVLKLQTLVETLGLSKIVFYHGWVAGKDKEEIFCNSDVFIHPSYFESFGIAIVEALSYGIPAITTEVGGISDYLIDGENGFIVEQRNYEDIYNAITKFEKKRSLISEMGERARETAKRFSADVIKQELDSIYSSLYQK